MTENPTQQKCEHFALRIVNLNKHLRIEHKEFTISSQIVRSGTSIAANYAESQCAASKRDFLNKIYIAFKECGETAFWLRLLNRSNYITDQEFNSIYSDCDEIRKILSSIIASTKERIKNSAY